MYNAVIKSVLQVELDFMNKKGVYPCAQSGLFTFECLKFIE
jgi:hypothetical protein